jgi:hypothetical protein
VSRPRRRGARLDFTQCDPDEEARPGGDEFAGNGLTYDALTDTYTYVWKTEKCWKGNCGVFTLSWTTAASTRPSSCSSKPDPLLSEHSGPFTGAAFAFSDFASSPDSHHGPRLTGRIPPAQPVRPASALDEQQEQPRPASTSATL